ncbi:MAG: FAD-binding oxidoreductase [Usitatibacter sp.]
MGAPHPALSWGRYPRVPQERAPAFWQGDLEALIYTAMPVLPYGLGRSYGDSCQNEGGRLVDMSRLDRLIEFDAQAGTLTAEAGVTLGEILRFALPRGWFLPVTPGTQFATLGGAIANDVHGKNHHGAGTFGRHVRSLQLLRSDGSSRRCSSAEETELYRATLGGLGLTGIVTSAQLALKPVRSAELEAESIAFASLEEFFELAEGCASTWEYTVAWVDCFARGASRGRGVFERARHVDEEDGTLGEAWRPAIRAVPFEAPDFALSAAAVRLFNAIYWRKAPSRLRRMRAERFLYPLDAIGAWNRIYGRRGFLQFQCVVPHGAARESVGKLLDAVAAAGEGSFLSVLKTFGELPSPGLMSFPRPGVTFALDFPMRGASTLALADRLEAIVCDAGGAIYPAKDARMSPRAFRASFAALERFQRSVDPAFSSSFWRRVHGEAKA